MSFTTAAGLCCRLQSTTGEEAMTDPTTTDRNRWIALYVLCAGMLMIVLDVTVVNVALPSIQDDLGFSQSSLAWVVNAYLIAFGGLLLLSGRFGDLLGRKRVLMLGLGVFTLASLLCGIAWSQETLVAARFIQGIGGAMSSAVILGMIFTMFPEPRELAKAIGVYGFVASAGGSIGLLAGGVLTQSINYHWIFFVNVPIGIVTAMLAQRLVPRDEGIGIRQGADVAGAVLITACLMLTVYTIVKPAAEDGWGSGQALGGLAVSLALLVAFIVRESRTPTPLVPLRIFRSRTLSGANVVQALTVAGMFGMFFLGSLYLQRVLGYSALEIGLAFLPGTVIMGTLSLKFAEPLMMRFGARRVLVPGLALVTIGLLLFARAPVDGSYLVDVFPTQVIMSIGIGISFPPLIALAMAGAPPQDAGLASGVVNTSAQIGGAIGLAVLATVSASRTQHLVADGHSAAAALTSGYHLAFVIAAGLVVAAIAVVLLVLEPQPVAHAEPAEGHEPLGVQEVAPEVG
jgi:EmrB/QacA subfamily drug resistance transporter